ncbi:hypothetical protein ACIA6E_18780 [Streptomyces sp. NPDC051815]|uniref:hypothetical protein n=1 Tax=Streptomyces sp. NPDC051815 TaxID=3365674 RepID=UPI00379BB576
MRKALGRSLVAASMTIGLALGMSTSAEAVEDDYYNISVNKGGARLARADGTISWIDAKRFAILSARLTDTACDGRPVYFFLDISGQWTGPKRTNSQGCGKTVNFGRIPTSDDSGIRYVDIWVCRDVENSRNDDCTHQVHRNPYFPG